MATRQHASKRTAQNLSNNSIFTPSKAQKSKIPKPNTPVMPSNPKEEERNGEMKQIYSMFETVMKKLEKLDNIETDVKEIKKSLEFAHAEIDDLKKENESMKVSQAKTEERVETLERERNALRDKVIDLQARSMRDNLLFFNMPENKDENTTEMIHEILETKLGIEDARAKVKIDRSHRIGKKRAGNNKPRPIVVKFNWHQDKEFVRINARKLKGTKIGVAEQFPEEIESVRKTLYPELKKAKAEGKKAVMVRDKLYIEGQVFYHAGNSA